MLFVGAGTDGKWRRFEGDVSRFQVLLILHAVDAHDELSVEVERVRACTGGRIVAVAFGEERELGGPVRTSSLHVDALVVEADQVLCVVLAVLPLDERHELLVPINVPVYINALVNHVTEFLGNALLALELYKNVLLLGRFEKID